MGLLRPFTMPYLVGAVFEPFKAGSADWTESSVRIFHGVREERLNFCEANEKKRLITNNRQIQFHFR